MGEALLDLSDHPLVREEEKKDRSSIFLLVLLVVLILMVLGIAFYLLIRKKEGYIEE
jgi:flagellar basal body-associated protein FliL